MVNLGAAVVILRQHEVLLMKREDYEVWTLPGGGVDPGESVADAAMREAREETGLDVQLVRLVGVYSRPLWNSHIVVFAAQPTGGVLQPQDGEGLEVRYFATNALPTDFIWWYRQPIQDALAGVGSSAAWTQAALWPAGIDALDWRSVNTLRDQASLSRFEFYQRYLGQIGPDGEQRIV